MEAHARYTLVGFIVLLLCAGIVWMVLWLHNRGGTGSIHRFSIYFRDQTLDGLQVDSYITMRGIKIGNVESLKLSPENIESVKVIIRLDGDAPVKEDTKAIIKRNLLTGLAYIDLQQSTNDSPPRATIPAGEDYPVIPEGTSELDKVASSLPGMIDNVNTLVQRASNFLSDENQKAFSDSIQELSQVAAVLGENKQEIAKIIKNTSSATKSVAKVSASVDNFVAKSGDQLEQLAEGMRGAVDEIAALADSLQKDTEASLHAVENSANLLTQQMYIMSQGLVQASDNVAVTLDRFKDPHSAIFGPRPNDLGPGESLPVK